jgi:signal transduction histidine kinase
LQQTGNLMGREKGTKMGRGKISTRGLEFLRPFAQLLDICIGIIGPEGKLVSYFAGISFIADYERYPALSGLFEGFFYKLTKETNKKRGSEVVEDPLGILVAAVRLESGFCLVLAGGLNKAKQLCRQDFLKRLKDYGVSEAEAISAGMRTISVEELKNIADRIQAIYRWFTNTLSENEKLREGKKLLEAIGKINKRTVKLLSSEHFDLKHILDLVVSSLITLCAAEGAWAFAINGADNTVVSRGAETAAFLGELEGEWERAVNLGEDPQITLQKKITSAKESLRYPATEDFSMRKGDFLICLGVVNAQKKNVKKALFFLARQALIVLELFGQYNLLQQYLGILLNSIRHGIVMTNKWGYVMLINPAASDFFSAQGITLSPGKPFEGPGLCQPMESALRWAISDGESSFQKNCVFGEGSTLSHINWDVIPLVRQKVISGAVLVFEDITENESLRSMRDDWERLTTASEVAAGIAHEVRNPLSTAGAAIQLLKSVSEEDRRKELLGKISAELERMNNILTDFLNLSKPKGNLVLEQVNLVRIIEEMEFLLKSEAYLHNVELEINCFSPEGFPGVMGEITGLKQVFLNIAKNAIEAMSDKTASEGRRLEISLHYDDDYARVSFEDNGPGIPPEYLGVIQRPFFTTKKKGTGLGLSISSSIIKRMGGELRIFSEPGQGTAVHVLLPVSTQNDKKE